MGCDGFDAGYEDQSTLVWRRGEERDELVGEQVMAKDIGREDLPEGWFIDLAITAIRLGASGPYLRSSGLAGGA